MWNANNPELWNEALMRYWSFVKPSHMDLEKEMDQLDSDTVRAMNAEEWYGFLKEKYFRWKYTAPNRYATTTRMLKSYRDGGTLPLLLKIKEKLFAFDKDDIEHGLRIVTSVKGLGTAGASGLLAVLFPRHFGTVDQFAVKALSAIPELPEIDIVRTMNHLSLKVRDGVVLITVMRRKAGELNRILSTDKWTPRRVDMVLWTCAR
jgi:hypothetical protein